MLQPKKNIWWYVKEGAIFLGSTAIAFLPEIIGGATDAGILKDYTLVSKAVPFISMGWRSMKLRKWYMEDVLPETMTKFLDKVPDPITGVKGSKKQLPSGLRKNE